MRTISLRILTFDGNETVAELTWTHEGVRVVQSRPGIRRDLDRLIARGLAEWVGGPSEPIERLTPATDETFLPRLAAHLHDQTRFRFRLESVDRIAEAPVYRSFVKATPAARADDPLAVSRFGSVREFSMVVNA